MDITLTVPEVAERLRVNPRTVYALLESGKLRGIRVGRLWRVPVRAVQEFLEGAPRGSAKKGEPVSPTEDRASPESDVSHLGEIEPHDWGTEAPPQGGDTVERYPEEKEREALVRELLKLRGILSEADANQAEARIRRAWSRWRS